MFNIFKKQYRNQVNYLDTTLSIPGTWTDSNKPSDDCVLAIKSDKKELFINNYPFRKQLDDAQILDSLMKMVTVRLNAEGNMGGGGNIIDQKIDYAEKN